MNGPPEPPPWGILIETARRDLGLSMREAARRAGVSEGWWRQVVRGYQSMAGGGYGLIKPPAATIAKLAKAVHVTPEQMEAEGRHSDAAAILRQDARPAPPPHREADFGGATDADRAALRPYVQEILRAAYEILGVADRFGPGDLPDPSEFPDGESAVSSIPGDLLFPDSPNDARTWDRPRLSLRQKIDVIGQGHRLVAQADERERRRTGLTAAAGHIPATGLTSSLVLVAGRAARASS